MQQTKPVFIIKKYRSILKAAIIIEAVNFIISLTDSIIAGNAVGAQAFAAIGLLAPFLSISVFISTFVCTGTVVNFSYYVGKFDKKRANQMFSQGVLTALLLGAGYALTLLIFGSTLINSLSDSPEIQRYLREYFYLILVTFFLSPLAFVLDYVMVADGGERLSVVANVIQIAVNVVLSLLFVNLWGLAGIALASVLSLALFVVIACTHFFGKKSTLKFSLYWSGKDFLSILKNGIIKASTYGLEAILTFLINLFALQFFNEDTLIILVAVERFLGLMTLFIGLSMSIQPLVGTLQGENNTKAQHELMKTALRDMIIISSVLSVITFIGAPVTASLFGLHNNAVYPYAIDALRIVSTTLIFQAVLVLFFVYYILIEKRALSFAVCLIKNLMSPAVMAVFFAALLRSQNGIWIGLTIAPVCSLLICALIVLLRYDRKLFPFLIPRDRDDRIFIYDFLIDDQNAAALAAVVEDNLKEASIPPRTSVLAGVISEDMLMMIKERNEGSKKPLRAECTIIRENEGVRVILRDSGVIFDITDTDGDIDSFRQYIVSNLMLNQERKYYMTTTGYNRNELFFNK